MNYDDLRLFNKLAESCGNRYLATKFIAKKSRKLAKTVPGYILDSKLVSWALTGHAPDIHKQIYQYYANNPEYSIVEDYLGYVEDSIVRRWVKRQYVASIKAHHLVYPCDEELSPFILSRICILLRMIWYDVQNYEEEHQFMSTKEIESVELLDSNDNPIEPKPESNSDSKKEAKSEVKKESKKEPSSEPKKEAKKIEVKSSENAPADKPKESQKEEAKPKKEPNKAAAEASSPKKVAKPALASGLYEIINLPIYTVPGKALPPKVISGNIEVTDEVVADYRVIKYVNPGFGLVLGYIPEGTIINN